MLKKDDLLTRIKVINTALKHLGKAQRFRYEGRNNMHAVDLYINGGCHSNFVVNQSLRVVYEACRGVVITLRMF